MNTEKIFYVKVKNIENFFLGGYYAAYVAMNEAGQFGYLPNETKPYCPVGGKKALESVKSILIFK